MNAEPGKPAIDPAKAHISAQWKATGPLTTCAFDPSGRYVFAGSENRSIARFEVANGKKSEAATAAHASWPLALACTPDGLTLFSGGSDDQIVVWTAASEGFEPVRVLPGHSGWVRALAVSPDGAFLATAGNDGVVRVLSVANLGVVRELRGHERPVYSLAYHPSGEFLLSGDLMGVVRQWAVESANDKEVRSFKSEPLHKYEGGQGVDYGGIRAISFAPDGHAFVTAGLIEASNPLGAVSNPALMVFDWTSAKASAVIRPKADLKGVAWGVVWHPAGFLVMASGGTGGGHLLFFKPDQTNEFAQLNLGNTARSLSAHPDGFRLATAHHDHHVRLIDLRPKA